MSIKYAFLFSALFLFLTACADPRTSLSLADPDTETFTKTQTVQLRGNESFLYRVADHSKGMLNIQRASDLTHINIDESEWRKILAKACPKVTTCSDDSCLESDAQRAIATNNTEKNLTVLLHYPGKGKTSDLVHTFDLPQMLQFGAEQIKLAMLLAQNDEQRTVISEAAREAGIEWPQKAIFKAQKIWTRHQFEITGALYMGGFYFADLLLQKTWAFNPYAASALYATTMTYQLWNSRHWGDVSQSTAALGALGALSLARYKGILGF
jgi:hypothetical protein